MENPNSGPKYCDSATKKKEKKSEYEFCRVCRLNHNQGLKHKYFPSHKKSLSHLLLKFQAKMTDILSCLKNPGRIPSCPEIAPSRDCFWCAFCETDVNELGSTCSRSNAIYHLASTEHLKNLKHFMWKYGGGTDSLDTFRISGDALAKWEKKCKLLNNEAVSSDTGSHGLVKEDSNDIHHEASYETITNFKNNNSHSLKSGLSSGVMPLQSHTNENQISCSPLWDVTNPSLSQHGVPSSPANPQIATILWSSSDQTVTWSNQNFPNYSDQGWSNGDCPNTKVMYQVYDDKAISGNGSSQGLQNLAQISWMGGETGGNVHSGAPPPWLKADEIHQLDTQPKPDFAGHVSSSTGSFKSRKLNPKRVGAAWAERRKMELEKEKRGEIVKSNAEVDWLPNFGRVWQSGSRKESRKEFEKERQKIIKNGSESEMPSVLQPYISKRMRRDTSGS